MNVQAIWTVFQFEVRRSLTPVKLLFWTALAMFPSAIVMLIRVKGGSLGDRAQEAIILFVLIPEAVCVLGLLLWATPAVHAEMESRTWSYLVVRSAGKGSVLLGKYLAAVAWTATAAWLALMLTLLVASPVETVWRLGAVFVLPIPLSCFAYGALYLLLGIIFLHRGLVVAVAYTCIFEVMVPFIPAMINQLTMQYHLRCIMERGLRFRGLPAVEKELLFGTAPAWQHVLALLGGTAGLLAATVFILSRRELIKADES